MDILDQLNTEFTAWKPEIGETVIGEVVAITERTSDYGTYPMLNIATTDGRFFCVHAFHTVLKSELARQAPKAGDNIGIRYIGKSDRGYENYKVAVTRAEGTEKSVDWEAHGISADADLSIDEPPADYSYDYDAG